MRKVLITGSSGFIGKNLTLALKKKGYDIIEINRSTGNIFDARTLNDFKKCSVSHVFHLAGKIFIPDSWQNPASFYEVNTMGTLNVLELCRLSGASLTFVSAYLYGQPEYLPIAENHKVQPNNPYAHTKFLAEQLCEFYANKFGVKICVLRPFNVFGIGQDERFLIPSIIKQALIKEEIKVKDLTPKRDYIYIDDLVNAILLAENAKKQYSVYNIGSGYSLSVKDIINMVQKIINSNKPVVSLGNVRKNEIDNVIADISRAKRELKWYPKFSVEEGLREVIDYERGNIYEK